MEKNKYVTANDYYPVNRSMLYGVYYTFNYFRFFFNLKGKCFVLDGCSNRNTHDDHFSVSTVGG